MDIQRESFLDWPYFYQEKDMESLRQSLVLTSMELENTRFKSEEELRMKDDQIIHLKYLLDKTIKERDEAEDNCQRLNLEKNQQLFLLHQKKHQSFAHLSATSSNEDEEPIKEIGSNNGFISSDCEESIVSSPPSIPPPPPPPPPLEEEEEEKEFPFLSKNRALPEKGKFLEAVMNAGPLLQNLMLAGPLPQWRHPPPPLDTCQIPPPPLTIPSSPPPQLPPTNFLLQDSFFCGKISRKRGPFDQESDNSNQSKYQRLLFQ